MDYKDYKGFHTYHNWAKLLICFNYNGQQSEWSEKFLLSLG